MFWWASLQVIAPISDPAATAETITRMLNPAYAAHRLAGTAMPKPVLVPVLAAWKQARRARLIEMLGGECVRCGATEDLEFDHVDPSTKVFAVCAGLSRAWDVLVEEASKTQLLCKPCHMAKGAEDRPDLKHGAYYVYWYWNCRCDPCRAANARKSAALRAKRRDMLPATSEPGISVNSDYTVTSTPTGESRTCSDQDFQLPRQDSNLEPAG